MTILRAIWRWLRLPLCQFCSYRPATTTHQDSPWSEIEVCARCESELGNREPSDRDTQGRREVERMATGDVAMKALTIKQPWATLIMHAGKDIENRDWPTKLRGRIAVHSSKKMDEAEMGGAQYFMDLQGIKLPEIAAHYPTGSIIGTVEIVDCVRKSDSQWFMGEYGFVLANPIPCTPIPFKGALGFWEVPVEIAEILNAN